MPGDRAWPAWHAWADDDRLRRHAGPASSTPLAARRGPARSCAARTPAAGCSPCGPACARVDAGRRPQWRRATEPLRAGRLNAVDDVGARAGRSRVHGPRAAALRGPLEGPGAYRRRPPAPHRSPPTRRHDTRAWRPWHLARARPSRRARQPRLPDERRDRPDSLAGVSTPSRVFVGRLTSLSVFDPLGDQVGRVRDVVVTFGASRRRPRVIGLVVEVPGPAAGVRADDPRDLRRRRPGHHDRPGQHAPLRAAHQRGPRHGRAPRPARSRCATPRVDYTATVEDVAIERERTRDWSDLQGVRPAGAARAAASGRFRRRRGATVLVADRGRHRHTPAPGTRRARPSCSRPTTTSSPPTSPR